MFMSLDFSCFLAKDRRKAYGRKEGDEYEKCEEEYIKPKFKKKKEEERKPFIIVFGFVFYSINHSMCILSPFPDIYHVASHYCLIFASLSVM